MRYEDKQELKWMIAELIISEIHTKDEALRQIVNWINNYDRGRP